MARAGSLRLPLIRVGDGGVREKVQRIVDSLATDYAWLLSRENFSNKDLIIELDSRRIAQRFSEEEVAQFLITPANPNNQSFAEDSAFPGGNGRNKEIRLHPNRVSSKTTNTHRKDPPLEPGIYQLQAVAGTAEETSTITFQVSEKSIELTQPEADPDFLRQLSAATEKYGGQSFGLRISGTW